LLSDVPILVDVVFQDQGGAQNNSITLASAGPATFLRNFSGAPIRDTFYPVALANSLAGRDLRTSAIDINVSVNSNSELSGSLVGGELPTFVWYYGLDNNAPPRTIDFLSVLTHELGHGLGFVSSVNLTSGALSFGFPDSYITNLFDSETQKRWIDMSDAERLASASNDPDLTWDGAFTRNAVSGESKFLSAGSSVTLFPDFPATQGDFGGSISSQGFTGNIVLTDDGSTADDGGGSSGTIHDAAQDIINGNEVRGNIALIERGIESFYVKVQRAQAVGATGVILLNNRDGDTLLIPGASGSTAPPIPTIPVVLISENSGDALVSMLNANPALEVTMTSSGVLVERSGIDRETVRARMHAPASIRQGSSVSHWSTASSPNLLMEPSINPNLSSDLDLSPLLMKDIGWSVANVRVPHLTYDQWLEENGLVVNAPNTGAEDDLDGDGVENLLEYFYGSDPTSATPTVGPVLSSTPGAPSLSLTVDRSVAPNDLSFDVERSSDLGSSNPWTAFNVTPLAPTQLPEQQERLTLPIPTDQGDEFFFRLRVEQP